MQLDLSAAAMADAPRLDRKVRASIQQNGRMSFNRSAASFMGLEKGRRVIIFCQGERNLAGVVVDAEDPRGFELKESGSYPYLGLKQFLLEKNVDFQKNTIVYDITCTDSKFEDRPVFFFERRDIIHE